MGENVPIFHLHFIPGDNCKACLDISLYLLFILVKNYLVKYRCLDTHNDTYLVDIDCIATVGEVTRIE